MTTISDVAQLAGVTKGTASRALRDLPNVSPDTRRRVLDAARMLSFVATPSAARLATGRTSSVGLVVPFVTRWFFGNAISGAESVLRDAKIDVLLYNLSTPQTCAQFFERMPLHRRVDGVLVLTLPVREEETTILTSLQVPLVLIGASSPGVDSVGIDDFSAAETAVRHLINLGHTRIGFIGGDPEEPLHFTAPIERMQGYLAAIGETGLPYDPRLVAPADFTTLGGEAAAGQLLSLDDPPTAIFAASDEMAMGAMLMIDRLGMSVPRDISVIGFDDHEMARSFGLTTIAQPVAEQGAIAARVLLEALANGAAHEPRRVNVSTRLVVRNSTSAPRGAGPATTDVGSEVPDGRVGAGKARQ
jgi:LacI family transcriptional regulator, repressor for deo operon, udp, cdd, tsx, nupC, and nupG